MADDWRLTDAEISSLIYALDYPHTDEDVARDIAEAQGLKALEWAAHSRRGGEVIPVCCGMYTVPGACEGCPLADRAHVHVTPQVGWRCPNCGAGVAPQVSVCPQCNPSEAVRDVVHELKMNRKP